MADDAGGASSGKLSFNERAKLTASYINGIAIAVMAAGGFSPIVLTLQGESANSNLNYFALACFVISLVLHLIARSVLEGLRD